MKIVIGTGVNRHEFERSTNKVERERMAEDIKAFLFRPATLKR